MYVGLKHLHTTVITLTVLFFMVRWFWLMTGSGMLQRRWVRITPHVIDTVLLVSALAIAWMGWRWPAVPHDWITAKVIGLVVYIGLGVVALKRARTPAGRVAAFAAALAVYGYLVLVALTKTPMPL